MWGFSLIFASPTEDGFQLDAGGSTRSASPCQSPLALEFRRIPTHGLHLDDPGDRQRARASTARASCRTSRSRIRGGARVATLALARERDVDRRAVPGARPDARRAQHPQSSGGRRAPGYGRRRRRSSPVARDVQHGRVGDVRRLASGRRRGLLARETPATASGSVRRRGQLGLPDERRRRLPGRGGGAATVTVYDADGDERGHPGLLPRRRRACSSSRSARSRARSPWDARRSS